MTRNAKATSFQGMLQGREDVTDNCAPCFPYETSGMGLVENLLVRRIIADSGKSSFVQPVG